MNKYTSLFLLILLYWSCEKREILDIDFPQENDIFCELIGIPEQGFFGNMSRITSANTPIYTPITADDECQINIYENNVLIYDQTLINASDIYIPYPIDIDAEYRLVCNCKNESIRSKAPQSAPAAVHINDSSAYRFFVDSLNLHVVDINYNINHQAQTDAFYYAYLEQVAPFPAYLNPSNLSQLTLAPPNTSASTIQRYKRLPSLNFNDQFASVLLISMDKDLFQYTRNIYQLEQIPNDEIANHNGNLEGGVGYFGIIQFDEVFLPL